MRGTLTTKRPSLSRITGLAPTSLPVIFSRIVVFPAFRRPMISTRNRLHSRLISSDKMFADMLVRSSKQSSRCDDAGELTGERRKEIESEVQRSTFIVRMWLKRSQQTLSSWHCIAAGTWLHPSRASAGTVSDRKEAIERGTYRRLSPPPQFGQTEVTEPPLMLY